MAEDPTTTPRHEIRVTELFSGAAVEAGQSILLTLRTASPGHLDLIMPHDLAPGLQRLLSILADRASQAREQQGSSSRTMRAERVSRIDFISPAPDGSIVISLATQAGHPLQFTLPQPLAAEFAAQLSAALPQAHPPKTH